METNRRELLSIIPAGIALGTAGCVASPEVSASSTPDGMSIESAHWNGSIFEDVAPHADASITLDEEDVYVAVFTNSDGIRSRLHKEKRLEHPDDVERFITQTDFDQSYVVAVKWMGGSRSSILELDEIERTDDGIHIEAVADHGEGARLRDLSIQTLLVRITDEERGVPEEVTADVHDPA